jgi:NAD(P)-dependent dehydrogenase (short-subunit alcohol dehydrogenase family)
MFPPREPLRAAGLDCSYAAGARMIPAPATVSRSPDVDQREQMKTAVVTGAAQGVGLAAASHLARLGYRVILTDIQALDTQLSRLRTDGLCVEAAIGDVSSEAFVEQLAQDVCRDYGAADVLVNNAGVSLIAAAEDTTAAQWQRVMNINLLGPFLLCKYLGAQMPQQRSGSIVNVASVAGLAGISHRSAYNASKHGLIGLTRTLAAEWGGRGVRVNAVCPGWIKTEMDVADQGSGAYTDQDIIDRVPLARFARAQDVAAAIAFLADSDLQGFINGVSLPVDGGWLADGSWNALRTRTRSG